MYEKVPGNWCLSGKLADLLFFSSHFFWINAKMKRLFIQKIAGWWFQHVSTPPKQTYSVGMMTFPIYGKVIQMFQTTNQNSNLNMTSQLRREEKKTGVRLVQTCSKLTWRGTSPSRLSLSGVNVRRNLVASFVLGNGLKTGPELVWELLFFSVWDFFFWICCSVRFPCNLQHFGARSCHFNGIATFWSSNLSFSMIFVTCWCSKFHIGWYFATRGHLGFV